MEQETVEKTFRADFNETTRSVEECEELIRHAVQHGFGLSMGDIARTGASENGDVQNVWLKFVVYANDVPEEDRSVKGRLLEHLSGTDVRLNEL